MSESIPTLKLKKKREVPIRAGHPWVFSNALATELKSEPGILVKLVADDGKYLGTGIYNPKTSIRVRLLTRERDLEINQSFFENRFQVLAQSKESHLSADTNAFRLVHGDADGLPGLIIDFYQDVCVFQIHTAGMDRFRDWIIGALKSSFSPRAIVERSDLNVRKREGLKDGPTKVHFGSIEGPVSFKEKGIHFLADVLKGQKTGFFLDQREAREEVGQMASQKSVLNLFCYTGAFSVHAAKGGAKSVTSVDSSLEALELAQKHFELNGFDPEDSNYLFVEGDVFDFCSDQREQKKKYDLVICDPPAFAKSLYKHRIAMEAYMRVNRQALALVEKGGILVTSSCSGVITAEDFRSAVRVAGGKSGCNLKVLKSLGQPFDHTDNLAFPEGRYLKTLILEVT